MTSRIFSWLVAATLGLATPVLAGADRLVVDLAAEPSTLDPQIQWNPDSYYVYRNIFDNLVTRDDGARSSRRSRPPGAACPTRKSYSHCVAT
jgi:ABC-type oligopeptide transport system substrate-binding subunit